MHEVVSLLVLELLSPKQSLLGGLCSRLELPRVLFPLVLHFVGFRAAHGRQPGVVHKLHVPLLLTKRLVMPRPCKNDLAYGARPANRGDPIVSVPRLFGKGKRFVSRVLVFSQGVLLAVKAPTDRRL